METKKMLDLVRSGDKASLARCISIVENESAGYEEILHELTFERAVPVIGFTGPPGAGKSTLINALIKFLISGKKKIAVLAIDPTSPFTKGALLGDRVRMTEHFGNDSVFIRSLATRGSLGGLSGKTIEVTDVLKQADFDFILIETVGVGQSEVEIASLADTTVLVLVPGSGDEVQLLKSGILEIADIFVVNKSDRGEADAFVKKISEMVHSRTSSEGWLPPVIKTSALNYEGITELAEKMEAHKAQSSHERKLQLLAERAYRLISQLKMKSIDMNSLEQKLQKESVHKGFNLYSFVHEQSKM